MKNSNPNLLTPFSKKAFYGGLLIPCQPSHYTWKALLCSAGCKVQSFFISKYIAGTSGEDVSWEPRTVGNPPLLAQITWYRDQSDLVLCWYIIN